MNDSELQGAFEEAVLAIDRLQSKLMLYDPFIQKLGGKDVSSCDASEILGFTNAILVIKQKTREAEL